MNAKILFGLLLILSGGLLAGCTAGALNRPAGLPICYDNQRFDFTLFLPASWTGYSVRNEQWKSNQTAGMVAEQGPIIILRPPQWKTNDLYQEIPIMIFTRQQWDEKEQGKFFPYAGGMIKEIGHNQKFVFGLYSRYNARDDVKGWKEADDIISRNVAANQIPHLYPEDD